MTGKRLEAIVPSLRVDVLGARAFKVSRAYFAKGVAAGRVILFEGDDYIGRPVNLAARLCDEAEPHQLLVTASLFDASGEGLAHRRLGPHEIRGFNRPVEVVDMGDAARRHMSVG